MFGPQFVEDVGGVEAGVVTQLSGDDLQGLCVDSNQQLLLPGDGSGIIPQVLGQLHLYGSSPRDDGVILEMGKEQLAFYHQFARLGRQIKTCQTVLLYDRHFVEGVFGNINNGFVP